jgi:glycosyltransferase involved in cell wall biosynthesis
MNILYHVATLPPKMPQAEAISQEIAALRERLGGDVVYVNPNPQSPLYVPRLLFGFHRLKELRSRETGLHLHHFYNPDPFLFPYLRRLRRPVVYSVTCGVGERRPNTPFFSSLAAVAVSDERSLKRLTAWGLENAVLVRPGIDTARFTCSPLPLRSEIRLMVGSAPWTKGQFRTKGVDALLGAARQAPHLRLVFLWRGLLAGEMERRVRQMDLEKQVTVLDRLVDVNRVLAGAHASITLATAPGIVKSYPHSLLESLAAGKPVLVSRAIPMADYVAQASCGKVVERVTPAGILAAVEALAREYEDLRRAARRAGQADFSQQAMIASFREVYERIVQPGPHGSEGS